MRGTHIEFEVDALSGNTALVAADDSIWLCVRLRWWDLATLLWWVLTPSSRHAWVRIQVTDGNGGTSRVRTRAVRVAQKFVRVRGILR